MAVVINFILTSYALAQKRFLRQVRENILGYFWALLTPAIYAVFFLMVKRNLSGDVGNIEIYRESALRAFIGLSLLQLWFQIIQDVTQLVRSNKGVLRALTTDIYPFFFALVIEAFFSLIIRLMIIIPAIIYFDFIGNINFRGFLSMLLALITILSTAFFIGLLLAPWASLFNDVRKFLSSALMPVALLSPIFYAPVDAPGTFLYWVNHINPFASILSVMANTLFNRSLILFDVMCIWLIVSMLLMGLLLIFLKKQVPVLLERMGA